MFYKVKIWIENNKIMCCSGICNKDSCPRYNTCDTVDIEVRRDEKNGNY